MNIIRVFSMQIIALVWMSIFGLILPILWVLLDFMTGKETGKLLHDFWVGWAVMTVTFWIVDIFYCWAIKNQKGTSDFTAYPDDFPLWKKFIHYSTIGKYSKFYK